jgi:hypothetical protein
LAQLYTQRTTVGGLAADHYPSSSEANLTNAISLNFSDSVFTPRFPLKTDIPRMRPVRAFG